MMMNKKFYVVSPDKEKISKFIEKLLINEKKDGMVKISTEKIKPKDSIMTYVILNKDNIDWFEYYMDIKNSTIVTNF